jgi:hypothetical protein
MKLIRRSKGTPPAGIPSTIDRLGLYSKVDLNSTTVLVDIGVSDGRFISASEHLFPNVHTKIGIDPIAIYERSAKFNYVQAIIGGTCSEVNFNFSSDLFTSSKLYAGVRSEKVQQFRLDCLLQRSKIAYSERIFLKIDSQGMDIECLESGGDYLKSINLVLIELQMKPYTIGMSYFSESVERLSKLGYEACEFLNPVDRSLDGTLGQIDLLVARKDSKVFSDLKW